MIENEFRILHMAIVQCSAAHSKGDGAVADGGEQRDHMGVGKVFD